MSNVETVKNRPRIIFFGTPEFSVPALTALVELDYEIALVVTQPDKPAGRGQQLTPPPVKEFGIKNGFPIAQPTSIKNLTSGSSADKKLAGTGSAETFAELLNSLGAIDLCVVIAYGKIIPQALLDFPKYGCINVHASLLPRWRGAAPIQRAIESGDAETGVCIMKLEAGLDTGPVYSVARTPISPSETAQTLHDRLSELGARLLKETAPKILQQTIAAQPQTESGITYAERWLGPDCEIHWAKSGSEIDRRIRASAPRPGAYTQLKGERIKVFRATLEPRGTLTPQAPGTIVEVNRSQVIVATGSDDYIAIEEMQFPGRKRLPVEEILKSRAISKGELFGSTDS